MLIRQAHHPAVGVAIKAKVTLADQSALEADYLLVAALWLVLQPTIRNNAQLPHLSRHSIASLYHPQPIFESVFWHCVEGQQHYNGMTPGVHGNGFVANVTSERACKRVDMRKQ